MKLTCTDDRSVYTLERDNGSVDLTANEISFLVNQFNKLTLRDNIEYHLHEEDGESINLEAYPYGYDALVDEVFTALEDEVDYGNLPDDDDIQSEIIDTCGFYDGVLID